MDGGELDFTVRLGLGAVEEALAMAVGNAAELFPNQIQAVATLAQLAQRRWIEYALGARPLPDGRTISPHTGGYSSSVKIRQDGLLSYIIYSDDPKAGWLEFGTPAWDMKKLLGTSHKTRVSEDGTRYLIMPFRHGAGRRGSGALAVNMPQQAQTWWAAPQRKASVVTGHYLEASPHDPDVKATRRTYRWGDRLTRADVEGMGLNADVEGKNLVGMVRMQNNEERGGQYLTFRTMSDRSPGWRVPERRGYGVAQAVYDWVLSEYQGLMRVALEEDVAALELRSGG